ncbi:hypothetical protein [Ferrimonas sp. SCSIO 43195]|uniref:hypothetical protein n=1 Tax=Ferrimonas sp. SCSIO 43195 TaxID=2822844 RepID=UPI002074D029|nr:hypothetical protein [Ferrimonas sp. SCSIO 43195]USD38844.1 hypothetical protein J8Z22_07000 [Ferrimonas sp. SCSIO 43195]
MPLVTHLLSQPHSQQTPQHRAICRQLQAQGLDLITTTDDDPAPGKPLLRQLQRAQMVIAAPSAPLLQIAVAAGYCARAGIPLIVLQSGNLSLDPNLTALASRVIVFRQPHEIRLFD